MAEVTTFGNNPLNIGIGWFQIYIMEVYVQRHAVTTAPSAFDCSNWTSCLYFDSRYNPENLAALERYVDIQVRDNAYDLEANLAVLKL